jgi:hypothetical protein
MLTVISLTFMVCPSRRSAADDETQDLAIEVIAPLDGKSCDTAPPSITVLGLTIDISAAEITTSAPASATGDFGR